MDVGAGAGPPKPASTIIVATAVLYPGMTDPSRPDAPAVPRPQPRRSQSRLNLMQLMLVMSLLALLAMWIIPHHQRYLKHHASERAAHDLQALQQHILSYWAQHPTQPPKAPPAPMLSITSADGAVNNTVSLLQQPYAQGWRPEPTTSFEFGAAFEAGGYTLTALGQRGLVCQLAIVVRHPTGNTPQQVVHTALGPDCGFQDW